MLVLVQVSSMKTSREGSSRSWYLSHCPRLRATSGRSCSSASSVFFIGQALGMDELPYRTIVDLEAPLGQLGDKPHQREVLLLAALDQPVAVRVPDRLGLVTAHLT